MTDRFLIVGLGNPGREYEDTRHNIGFRCVEALAQRHALSFGKKQSKALVADGTIGDKKVILAKPQTFMNLSGESVRPLVDFYKIPLPNLLVISDDLDINFETLRIREKGSAGGQNGLKSIIQHLGTQEFARLRFGISRPPGRMDAAAYVLQGFSKSEAEALPELLDRVMKACEVWLTDGLNTAMTQFNGETAAKPPAPRPPKATPSPKIPIEGSEN